MSPDPSASQPDTLRDLLRATPRVAPERATRLLGAIARALATWHARAGAYGALTPERVLLWPGDAVTLATPPRADASPAPWPAYLAPEQIDGRSGDARSDIYALGLVGWEMLAGQQPWEGESLYGLVVKQREQDLPRVSTLRPGMPRPLVTALEGCLHKAPGDRWQTIAEFLAALEPGVQPAPAPAPDFPAGFPRERRAQPAPPAGAVAGAVARAAAAGAVPGTGPEPRAVPPLAPSPRNAHPPPAVRAGGDEADGDEPARASGRSSARPPARAPRRGRWLAGAVLGVALLGAGAAALVAVRGRTEREATQTWLDQATAPAAAVGAVPATTTRENTTAVPIHRSGGAVQQPVDAEELDGEEEPAGDSVVVEPPFESPALEPTPPFVASPGRPTVPRPTVPRLPPDTAFAPDSLDRR